MLAAGRVQEAQARIVWRSEPLPNDALAVRGDLDAGLKAALAAAAIGLDAATAQRVMPANYTGWEAARPDSYALIETAGRALGRIGGG
jgi:phosphonate transport system substrate-binding protein